MEYFRKDEFMKAALENNIHFIICSNLNYGYLKWVAELSEPKPFNSRQELVQYEKEF
jgi:hypothetical protein